MAEISKTKTVYQKQPFFPFNTETCIGDFFYYLNYFFDNFFSDMYYIMCA